MAVIDKNNMREMNEFTILNAILEAETISRAELSKKSGLNKSSVSSVVTKLLEQKIIVELGDGESSGGRKPILVKFDEKCGTSLSIDLAPDKLNAVLNYLDGEIILYKTHREKINSKNAIKILSKTIEYFLGNAPYTHYGIVGITIAIHGVVRHNKIIFSPFYNIDGLKIKAELEKKYGIHVKLENEANLSVIGEKTNYPNQKNVISISIHSGIGAGIIIDNNLIKGGLGFAGEIGHTIIVPNGKKCSCGNKGCVEQYASEQKILKTYIKKVGDSNADFNNLKENYIAGKGVAVETISEFIKYITILTNNLIMTFDPQVLIINCKITNEIQGVIEKIGENLNSKMCENAIIIASELKDNASLVGGFLINKKLFLEKIIFRKNL